MLDRILYSDTEIEKVEQILTELGFDDYVEKTGARNFKEENKQDYEHILIRVTRRESHLLQKWMYSKKSNITRVHFEDLHNDYDQKSFCSIAMKIYQQLKPKLDGLVICNQAGLVDF